MTNFSKRELNHLALCLGRCNTCSETTTCRLKMKVQQTDNDGMDGIVYDALAGYYGELYGVEAETRA